MKKIVPNQIQKTEDTPAKGNVTPANFLLSLIIPCYNESARIDLMLQGLADSMKNGRAIMK